MTGPAAFVAPPAELGRTGVFGLGTTGVFGLGVRMAFGPGTTGVFGLGTTGVLGLGTTGVLALGRTGGRRFGFTVGGGFGLAMEGGIGIRTGRRIWIAALSSGRRHGSTRCRGASGAVGHSLPAGIPRKGEKNEKAKKETTGFDHSYNLHGMCQDGVGRNLADSKQLALHHQFRPPRFATWKKEPSCTLHGREGVGLFPPRGNLHTQKRTKRCSIIISGTP